MRRTRWLVAAAVAGLGLGVGAPAVSAEAGGASLTAARVEAFETYASGRVVDAATGTPIRGAVVRYLDEVTLRMEGVDRTGADGRFYITGLAEEEHGIRVTAPRYVGGYLGNLFLLYPTFGEAMTFGTGELPEDIRMVHR